MKHDRTFDCEPTLTDSQVIEFCRKGYMVFEGVVPEEVNQRTTDFLEEHSGSEPTELLPGSHFLRCQHRFMGHLDNLRYRVKTAAPAGSIFLTIYQIWHRGGLAQSGLRNNLKYFYWRTTPPTRD